MYRDYDSRGNETAITAFVQGVRPAQARARIYSRFRAELTFKDRSLSKGYDELQGSLVSALQELESDDLETSVLALDAINELIRELTILSVERMTRAPEHPEHYAERISNYSLSIREVLLEAFHRASERDRNTKLMLAQLLLEIEDRAGVGFLLSYLGEVGEWSPWVINKLVNAGIEDAIPVVIERLRRERDGDLIVSLLHALSEFCHPVPDDIRKRLLGLEIDKWRRAEMEELLLR